MKTVKYRRQLVFAMHLLFWILSFNLFNSFFNRGVESGYVLDDLELSVENVLLISNILIVYLLSPFIWFVKGIRRWIKQGVTALFLIFSGWALYMLLNPDDSIVVVIILSNFFSNFLYVLIFHVTIIASVYLNINILIKKLL